MLSKTRIVALTALAAYGCLLVFGHSAEKPKPQASPDKPSAEASYKHMDRNRDGKLAKGEYTENFKDPITAGGRFDQVDKDHDGFLTLKEFKAGGEKMIPKPKPAKKPAQKQGNNAGKKGKKGKKR